MLREMLDTQHCGHSCGLLTYTSFLLVTIFHLEQDTQISRDLLVIKSTEYLFGLKIQGNSKCLLPTMSNGNKRPKKMFKVIQKMLIQKETG